MSRIHFGGVHRHLVFAVALALPGCGGLSDGTPVPQGFRLEINEARGPEYVNGFLPVKVRTQGGTPDYVELLRNGAVVAALRPPFEYIWDTRGAEEGVYRLQARAHWKGAVHTSEEHRVNVDRTGPTVFFAEPFSDNVAAHAEPMLSAYFTEPIRIRDEKVLEVQYVFSPSGPVRTARLSLAQGERSLNAPLVAPPRPPYSGSASFPLDDITDLAGNPARFHPDSGRKHAWSWSAPVFRRISDDVTRGGGRPALAIAPGGALVVAFADKRGAEDLSVDFQDGHHIEVMRLEGGVWHEVGAPFTAPGAPTYPKVSHPLVALDAKGQPVVAFQHQSPVDGRAELHVFRYRDSQWVALGGVLNAPEASELYGTALGVDGEGRPVLAWSSAEGIRVRRWESDQWVSLGDLQRVSTEAGATVAAYAPALSISRAGRIFLAWSEAASEEVGAGLYVRAWTDSGWEPVGGRLGHGSSEGLRRHVAEPALVTTPMGNPVAVWTEVSSSGSHEEVVVASWSGTGWALSPVPSIDLSQSAKDRRWPAVAVDGEGRALVTFAGGRPELGLYASWYPSNLHAVDPVWQKGRASSLVVDADGKPVIAWFAENGLMVARPNE